MADKSYDEDLMNASIAHYTENSDVKSNGVRVVPKKAYFERLEIGHGVTEADVKRVQTATSFEDTAAAFVALSDVEARAAAASKEELADDDFRRSKLQGTVRLPTYGGSTDITVKGETSNPIPFRGEGDADGPTHKLSYGVTKHKVNMTGRIFKDFHDAADERMRKALGVA